VNKVLKIPVCNCNWDFSVRPRSYMEEGRHIKVRLLISIFSILYSFYVSFSVIQ